MGLNVGDVPVTAVYVGSTPVTAVYVGAKKVWPTSEVHEVTLTNVNGDGTAHPLVTVTVPAGQTWAVTIEGTVTRAVNNTAKQPRFRIGATTSGGYAQGAAVDFSGTISATDNTIAMVTGSVFVADQASFVGTVTIEK